MSALLERVPPSNERPHSFDVKYLIKYLMNASLERVPLINTPEMNFDIRNNFVEDKDACSNKANFMNSNIPNYNRFDKLCTVENTQNDAKSDDTIETDVSKARQIPFVKSSKSAVKKRPEVVINKYPENQDIFGKENINAKRRHETYTDAARGNIEKDNRKIIMFTDSIPYSRKLTRHKISNYQPPQ